MTKRFVQFTAILLILVLHIGGILNVYASIATVQRQAVLEIQKPLLPARQSVTSVVDAKLEFNKEKKTQHPVDEGAYEKVEESDANRAAESNVPVPLFAAVLQQTITFSLFSLLYNSKQVNTSDRQLLTCFDNEKFILYQDFRI